ncbi:FAD-binding domain-containing protein [Xylariales sp. AK1849]|nr:FAD-binding domain-containing protein [Xylariales sp. AK1849]
MPGPMAKKSPFRVVVVGGSVAGLSLANMLQANNVDFIVLEAYPKIAPQVGASIGLLPHGNRILDQLGLFDKIFSFTPPVDSFNFRNSLGTTIAGHSGMYHSFKERHGYPILFLDRQTVLQVLYDNIKDKSKVLTDKRVKTVELSGESVKVIVTDGSSYTGDILVGGDGIHSKVRLEMWRLAETMSPGYFCESEYEAAPCSYNCVFGISHPCVGIEPGNLHSIFGEKSSYLVNGGPKGRVYWFQFTKLPQVVHGSKIPKYSKTDLESHVEARFNDAILPDLTFGDLYKQRVVATMTALPEYVYKQWYFDRIITLGDAAHKFHPIGGHGGNAAVETAATLTNLLVKALNHSLSGTLPTPVVGNVFSEVQALRRNRATTVMDYSHSQQRTEAMDTAMHKFAALYMLPLMDAEDVMYNFSSHIPSSEKLDMLPLKPRHRLIPFKDNLLSEPKSRGIYGWVLIALYLLCSFGAHYGMWIQSASWGLGDHVGQILTAGIFPDDPGFQLKRSYIGIASIDNYLTFLSAVYMPGLKGWDKSFQYLQLYLLGGLVQPIAVWSVESYRRRNSVTPVAFITFWLTLVQWAGVGIYMPLYYVAYTWISDSEPYWWALSRVVPTYAAKALLPANLIGYILPTVLMFIPWKSPVTMQSFEALWQVAPMLVAPLIGIMSAFYGWLKPLTPEEKRPQTASSEAADMPYIRRLYIIIFAMGAILHWYVLSKLMSSTDPDLTVASVFIPDFSATPKTLGQGMRNVFMADLIGFYAASYVWCCSAIWDLRRVGRTQADVGKASIVILGLNLIVGPGAAMSATWYWREKAMARTLFHKE